MFCRGGSFLSCVSYISGIPSKSLVRRAQLGNVAIGDFMSSLYRGMFFYLIKEKIFIIYGCYQGEACTFSGASPGHMQALWGEEVFRLW